MAPEKLIIGIDLGATKTSTALVGSSGRIVAHDYQETRVREGQEAVIGRMLGAARRVLKQGQKTRAQVAAVGIGAPGPLEVKRGIVMTPPNLPDWDAVPLKQLFEDGLGITTFLENDANAAALGEYRFGAGRGTKHMIYVTVSTGIGSGLIIDGKLYHGACEIAGEIGHTTVLPNGPLCGCGNRGCLEALASGTAIAHSARERVARDTPTLMTELAGGDSERITAELVAAAAAQGDAAAKKILSEAMDYLGIGMANLVNLFNPELIVIGGGLTKLNAVLFEPVRRAIDRRAFSKAARTVRIVKAELGDHVGVLGAAAVALAQISCPDDVFSRKDLL